MLAIVPARGGSRGLPGKHVRPFVGKPLIAHTLDAAHGAAEVSRTVVSTDDEEIAAVARRSGAEIPFMRPAHLASDTARTASVCVHVLDELERREGLRVEEFVLLQPTSPLRTAEDIDAAIRIFRERRADSVVSVSRVPKPLFWAHAIDQDGRLREFFPHHFPEVTRWPQADAPRQTFPEAYLPNGAVYVTRAALVRQGTFFGQRTYPSLMPLERSVDIDTLEDFEWAEWLWHRTLDAAAKEGTPG